MSDTEDTNAAVWKSDIGVSFWKSREIDRARRDAERRVMMAELLPFAVDEPFTFVDLGAGTGAAARTVLDHYPAAHAVLADFSPQMMAQGEVELEPYAGRYTYVEFDLTAAGRLAGVHPRPGGRRDQLAVRAPPQRRAQAVAVRRDHSRTWRRAAGTSTTTR